jgi:hypothetical protein
MTDRASIRARIAALHAKTTRNGCTEAEALAASEAAARLMRDYGLSDDRMEEAKSPERTSRPTWRLKIAAVIARCTNTRAVFTPGRSVLFIGRAPGPEIAVYLRDILNRAIAREIAGFKAGEFYRRRRSVATRRSAVADFTDGLAHRLCLRLPVMFRETMSDALLQQAIKESALRYPNAGSASTPERETRFDEAVTAGFNAGANVPLNHGVAARSPPKPAKVLQLKAPPAQGSLF